MTDDQVWIPTYSVGAAHHISDIRSRKRKHPVGFTQFKTKQKPKPRRRKR